jgi:hypothetical protein
MQRALGLRWQVGEAWAILESIEDFAILAFKRGSAAIAVTLLAAIEAHRLSTDDLSKTTHGEHREQFLPAARATLGDVGFSMAWDRGQAFTLENAIREALDLVPVQPAGAAAGKPLQ